MGCCVYEPCPSLLRSSDGQFLVVSSSDGYCSILSFEPGELGVPLSPDKLPLPLTATQQASDTEMLQLAENTKTSPPAVVTQKEPFPSSAEQKVNVVKPRRIRPTPIASHCSPDKQPDEVATAENGNCIGSSSLSSPPPVPGSSGLTLSAVSPNTSESNSTREIPSKEATGMQGPSSSLSATPRRVNFVTLSSAPSLTVKTPPTPSESDHHSLDAHPLQTSPKTGQTYPRHGTEEGTQSEEPMDV